MSKDTKFQKLLLTSEDDFKKNEKILAAVGKIFEEAELTTAKKLKDLLKTYLDHNPKIFMLFEKEKLVSVARGEMKRNLAIHFI